MPKFEFFGDNATAYNSRSREILLAGAAGTGKSVVLLSKVLTLLGKYPKCRGLFCRGTRASLTQSGLVTWEDDVLGPDHAVLTKNPVKRRVRQSYEFANGSELIVAGLDDPGKTLSAQYDFIYIQEATEEGVTLDTYETLQRALRNGRMVKDGQVWHQIMMDCNPTSPQHWLYKRAKAGKLGLFTSLHRNNPRYWDRVQNDWTPEGRSYVLGTLASMTGTRKKRFYYGEWVAAEGLVYDGFRADPDPETGHPGNMLPVDWKPDPSWRRVWGIDWGNTSPTVLQLWAFDGDGRGYMYKETYRTGQRPDILGQWARQQIERGEKEPMAIVCDHDPERKKEFETASGLHLQMADKVDRGKGIEAVQRRFDLAGDGRPRIYFRTDALAHEPDPYLVDTSHPTNTIEELVSYSWDTDFLLDTPQEGDDHGMDVMRYVMRYADNEMGDGLPWSPPPNAPKSPTHRVDAAFSGSRPYS